MNVQIRALTMLMSEFKFLSFLLLFLSDSWVIMSDHTDFTAWYSWKYVPCLNYNKIVLKEYYSSGKLIDKIYVIYNYNFTLETFLLKVHDFVPPNG